MRRFAWRWFAVSSVLAAALALRAETRPQYGGTLHVAMRAASTSLDPADASQPDSFARRSMMSMIFEGLVMLDDSGRPRAALAVSWQALPGNQRWRMQIRNGVKFHDGTSLTVEAAAASLRATNPTWTITAEGESVVIDCGTTDAELPAELALPKNAIVKRDSANRVVGTGPFQIADWQPGKRLTLGANENYWQGRAFLDGIEIEMGRNFRDQMSALELGRDDLVEVAPEQAHRTGAEAKQLLNSAPMELVALVFEQDAQTADEKLLREALSLSVERGSMRNVLLQSAGSVAAGVLPTWISGYGFIFPADADLARARHLREQVRAVPPWRLGYDGSDPIARLLAERIALNAKDAGLVLQPASTASDVRLLRIPLASVDPWIILANVASLAGLPSPKQNGGSVEDLYAAERDLIATQRLIPLFHLPVTYAASAAVRSWTVRSDGTWNLTNAWLGAAHP
jgi:peptide/nickel transport system substrate-binding protein